MKAVILVLIVCLAFFEATDAATNPKMKGETTRLLALNRKIDAGKSRQIETDLDMHQYWDLYRDLKQQFDSVFDDLICTEPEKLQEIHDEMEDLVKKVELGWNLKQDQFKDLKDILHHENYTVTGLSTGNDKVEDACKGLADYLDASNQTAQEEKVELDEHLQEVSDDQIAIDTHPCPCIWGQWEEWSTCTTTCEVGVQYREREIEKPAINNGTQCYGSSDENQACNEEVCCPVNCEWGEWEEWGSCPSGCPPQEKTRTRRRRVLSSCDGLECNGEDFEQKSCSREVELEAKAAALASQLANSCSMDEILDKSCSWEAEFVEKLADDEEDVRQLGKPALGAKSAPSSSCLGHCNHQAGFCPNFCGEDGYCCKQGVAEMGCSGREGGELFHTCVTHNEWVQSKPEL